MTISKYRINLQRMRFSREPNTDSEGPDKEEM
jgi:hypothetical protein